MNFKQLIICILFFYAGLLGIHFGVNKLFSLSYWNGFTPWVYISIALLSLLCIPLLIGFKRKDPQLFIQGFLSYTVIQMLTVITITLILVKKYPDNARNYATQLLLLIFATLVFQSILLLKDKGLHSEKKAV
ncbi:MAG: hypothetical protein ABI207_04170 [Crocinitomicaceae bacterium]